METVQQNGRFTLFSSKFLSIYSILYGKSQEMYRPGTTILIDASNLCTAVGGDQNKEFRGHAPFFMEKGGIKIYCYCIFHIDQKANLIY